VTNATFPRRLKDSSGFSVGIFMSVSIVAVAGIWSRSRQGQAPSPNLVKPQKR
jgi:hypothetical protein